MRPPKVRVCGGAIISTRMVLTAAHCVKKNSQSVQVDAENITVYIGIHNTDTDLVPMNLYTVEYYWIHPDYGEVGPIPVWDIAILALTNTLPIVSNYSRAIELPQQQHTFTLNTTFVASGWGWVVQVSHY